EQLGPRHPPGRAAGQRRRALPGSVRAPAHVRADGGDCGDVRRQLPGAVRADGAARLRAARALTAAGARLFTRPRRPWLDGRRGGSPMTTSVSGRLVGAIALAVSLAAACASSPTPNAGNGGPGGGDAGGNDAGGSRASKVAVDGYITAGPWMGYGFTATDPG